ncbi:trypsin-like serine peptidase [Tropicibacter naphthalenivorans]|uniref:Serine protease n=1 Tax=Tropicibacter naphthalenivorans TaxID=441103 RepID=A0A0P1FZV6_9RHOB|nr:serine protease [Tropicibacter naphthalenivorans]CUH74968.1 V8-like Glu-specific endopeptidase [Tropicibacter naphthalenivorans]SMC47714.1 V8-like Glu-specific endopeptidase [Tropicibacter naphthalenivorans]
MSTAIAQIASLIAALLAGGAHAQGNLWPDTENEVSVDAYANEPINTYAETADFRRMGRAVGMLNIVTDVGAAPCTAWIADERHIVTNNHCVPGVLEHPQMNATRIVSVEFLAGFTTPGQIEEAERFEVNPIPVETDKDLDFTVLEVMGNPSARYGTLPISGEEIAPGMPFWIIGHPLGKSQHISREGCRAATTQTIVDLRLRHTCDTLGGNSGSPIIDSSARQVIGLHNSGNKRIGVNFGIPMSMILAKSTVLRAAVPDDDGAQVYTFSSFPKTLAVGEELSVVADVVAGCAPTFVNVSPTGKVTPIPLQFFEKIEVSTSQTRYQVSPGGRYGLQVLPEDPKGTHQIGFICPPQPFADQEALKAALRDVLAALPGGLSGEAGGVQYRFGTYTID